MRRKRQGTSDYTEKNRPQDTPESEILIPIAARRMRLARGLGQIAEGVDPEILAEAQKLAAERAATEEKEQKLVKQHLPRALVEVADFKDKGELVTLVDVVDEPAILPLLQQLYRAAGITSDGFQVVEGEVTVPSDVASAHNLGGDALSANIFWREMPDGGVFQQVHTFLTRHTEDGDVETGQVIVLLSPNNLNISPYEQQPE